MFELLLVDDDRDVLELLALAFQRPGVRLRLARSFDEALIAAFAAPLHAAVVDVHLSDAMAAEGLELLQRLQRSRPVVPVVVITGSQDPGILTRAHQLGARSVLRKPLDVDGLEEVLRLYGLQKRTAGTAGGDGLVAAAGSACYSDRLR